MAKDRRLSRRDFLTTAFSLLLSSLISSCKVSRLMDFDTSDLFQKHFKEMSKCEVESMLLKLEAKYTMTYGRKVKVKATSALEGVEFAYALNLSKCIGCRRL
ncbi:MAG: hypothetical protein NZ583_08965 [Desulfobacterota bacterium]|nr:hypothetical protein [Thermodesulfobacteriota bacterium]MDW8002966.1 hypothetical protein [Deltaproteobacteria bacterium]